MHINKINKKLFEQQQEIEKEEEWRVKRAESEKSEVENILKIQIEEEKKQAIFISRVYLDIVDKMLGDQVNCVSTEWTISEQVRDKIVNDEVNTRLCSICLDVFNEMRKTQVS